MGKSADSNSKQGIVDIILTIQSQLGFIFTVRTHGGKAYALHRRMNIFRIVVGFAVVHGACYDFVFIFGVSKNIVIVADDYSSPAFSVSLQAAFIDKNILLRLICVQM